MVKFDLFDTIWKETVEISCEKYLEKYSAGNLVNHISKSRKKARRCYYEASRTFVYSYMIDKTHNIDRHKIASCMVKAILISKPLRVSFFKKVKWFFKKEKIDERVYLANQYIAINVAVLILEAYIRSDEQKDFKHKILFPDPFPNGEKNYIKDVCLDLYYTNSKDFNIITYANVFCLWEKYSCRRMQCENLIDAYRALLKDPDEYKRIAKLSNKKIEDHIDEIRFKQRDE